MDKLCVMAMTGLPIDHLQAAYEKCFVQLAQGKNRHAGAERKPQQKDEQLAAKKWRVLRVIYGKIHLRLPRLCQLLLQWLSMLNGVRRCGLF